MSTITIDLARVGAASTTGSASAGPAPEGASSAPAVPAKRLAFGAPAAPGTFDVSERGAAAIAAAFAPLLASRGEVLLDDAPADAADRAGDAAADPSADRAHELDSAAASAPASLADAAIDAAGVPDDPLLQLADAVAALSAPDGAALARAIAQRLSPGIEPAVAALARAPDVDAARDPTGALLQRFVRLHSLRLSASGAVRPRAAPSGADAGVAAATAAALEALLGRDDRVRIANADDEPWCHLRALRATFADGHVVRATGFRVGARVFATAGHVVFDAAHGGWARTVEVGAAGGGGAAARAVSLRALAGWVDDARADHDVAAVVLAPTDADAAGPSFAVEALSSARLHAQTAVIAGHPHDKPAGELWGLVRRLRGVERRRLVYDTPAPGALSGAPVCVNRFGMHTVVAIHRAGRSSGSALRVSRAIAQAMSRWAA